MRMGTFIPSAAVAEGLPYCRAMDLPPVRAHVYEVDPVNGLAAPDGRIFLTRGFIRKLDAGEVTPEELASVIAHELGHVVHGNARRRMIDFAGQNAIRMAQPPFRVQS